METLHVQADTEGIPKAPISLRKCNVCNKVSFLCLRIIKALKNPICGYVNREDLVKPVQI